MHLFTILSVNFSRQLTEYQFEDPYFLIRDYLGHEYKGKLDDINEPKL